MSKGVAQLFNLSGRVALVAGGAGYLGVPCCAALAHHGATVVVADRRLDAAQKAAEELAEEGLTVHPVCLDIANEDSIHSVVKDVRERFGRLDVAINATAFSSGEALERMTRAQWEQGLQVTLTGAFLFSRAAGQIMVDQGGGSIIQFSSMYGIVSPDPRMYEPPVGVNPVDYGVSKAGLLQLVRYQAVMWGPKHVRVNAIVPGTFPHPGSPYSTEAFQQKLAAKTPLGRVGKAREIAGAVVYLASDASSYVTGTQLVVDGGWTAW